MMRMIRYRGSVYNLVLVDIVLNSGGVSVVLMYVVVIWMLMIVCELCVLKVVGVEWMIVG